jgi:hypothetical protein
LNHLGFLEYKYLYPDEYEDIEEKASFIKIKGFLTKFKEKVVNFYPDE